MSQVSRVFTLHRRVDVARQRVSQNSAQDLVMTRAEETAPPVNGALTSTRLKTAPRPRAANCENSAQHPHVVSSVYSKKEHSRR